MQQLTEISKDEMCAAIPEYKRLQISQHVKHDGRCHEWQGAQTHGAHMSYGRFKFENRTYLAHRAQLIWSQGLPPSPFSVARHTCANRLCINPKHLKWGSHADNAQDRIQHKKGGNRPLDRKEALMHRFARGVQGFMR